MIEVITNKKTSLKEEAYCNNKCQSNARTSKESKYNKNITKNVHINAVHQMFELLQ